MKTRRKVLNILVTLSFLMTMLVPMAAPAAAADTYAAVRIQNNINDEAVSALANVQMTFPTDALANGDTVIISLPTDYQFVDDAAGDVDGTNEKDEIQTAAVWNAGTGPNFFSFPATVSGDDNGLWAGLDGMLGTLDDAAPLYTVTCLKDNEISFQLNSAPAAGAETWIYLNLGAVYVPSGEGKDITVTFDPAANSGFPAGSVVVGQTTGGMVAISVTDDETSNNIFNVTMRFKESTINSLKDEAQSLEFTLPDGYEWIAPALAPTRIYGDDISFPLTWAGDFAVNAGGDELTFNPSGSFAASTVNPACFELTFRFQVEDETQIEPGDIKIKVDGESDLGTTELTVGTYGEFGATVIADTDVPEIWAGFEEQEIADIIIEESMEGSLLEGRTVTLELPEGARWMEHEIAAGTQPESDTDEGLQLQRAGYTGTDDRVAKYTVNVAGVGTETTSAAEVKFEDLEVVTDPAFTGDLTIKVAGNAGVEGEITVAKVVPVVKMEAASKPNVVLGLTNQVGGDITLTEVKAEALHEGLITLRAPVDVEFAAVPTVEVTSGDIKIDQSSVTRGPGNRDVVFRVDNDSNTASTIKVSGIKYKVYRTIPEGDVKVLLLPQGSASDITTTVVTNPWPNTTSAASAVNAICVTPASSDITATSVFKIGDTNFTVNGAAQTMDVAPYIKGDRTYMPLRFAANAAGVTDANIMWNAADQSVILIKGDRVVKLTIGSTTMLMNGIPFTMDVAPELVDPGRTMLPVRWVAQALGCDVQWDEATQSVTIK